MYLEEKLKKKLKVLFFMYQASYPQLSYNLKNGLPKFLIRVCLWALFSFFDPSIHMLVIPLL